ncbi:peroxiredoxin family protein [Aureispira anguillae]|uniref:Peroxiredoxin family protein n=1 Tax=Aureispira anguillae TaxID=2864201 RepID=A0A915YM65_9BACT|nr:peroxiredoxin family protein [Aureispira anguillae]BDS15511.1 peroxiredoxin family protein [Aureispira anguillae]
MANRTNKYGLEGNQAPELSVPRWINEKGEESDSIFLADYEGKFKIIYCFQAWCPGCHSQGLPALKKMVEALKENDKVAFIAIQTVFEGQHENTFAKVKEIQKQYELAIPFGHDVGTEATQNISSTMYHYRTGGTPWFILIDQKGRVIFNDFHLNTEKAIEFLKTIC